MHTENMPDTEYVYHGSPRFFDHALPKRHVRMKKDAEGKPCVIFDQMSFHATPFRWIALAYTYQHQLIPYAKREMYYTMGIDLYAHKLEVDIHGTGTLEESLKVLYGAGGYVLTFRKEDFLHMEGLGNLEVVCLEPVQAVSIERIDDPVQQMQDAGVHFRFIDVLKMDGNTH